MRTRELRKMTMKALRRRLAEIQRLVVASRKPEQCLRNEAVRIFGMLDR